METLTSLFQTANSLSPLAIIGLLVGLLYVVLTNHKQSTGNIETLRSNDLSELGDMAETLRRIETGQAAAFATIIARLPER